MIGTGLKYWLYAMDNVSGGMREEIQLPAIVGIRVFFNC